MSKEFDKWLEETARRNLPNVEASRIFLPLYTKSYAKDPQCALQFGYAVLMGKPIFLLVEKGQEIPDTVKAVAKGIEYFVKEDRGSLEAATNRMLHTVASHGIKLNGSSP